MRTLRRFAAGLILVVLCIAGLGGCGNAAAGLSDELGGVGMGDVPRATPTQFDVDVGNQSGATVVFQSARLIPEPGFRTPRLLRVLTSGCCDLNEGGAWPSAARIAAERLQPLRGSRLGSGAQSHLALDLDLVAPDAGDYGFSAVQITVTKDGHPVTFASRDGFVVACVGGHPSAAACPGVHALSGASPAAYAIWLKHPSDVAGNGITATLRRAFPRIDAPLTVTTPHRSVQAIDRLAIGSVLRVADTPSTAGDDHYLEEGYSPGTVVTLLYHHGSRQVYADDYYGQIGLVDSDQQDGFRSGPGPHIYAVTDTGEGPNFICELVPSPIHQVELWLASGQRRTLPTTADSACYASPRPFALSYPNGHGMQIFLMTQRYRGRIPDNVIF